MENHRIVLTPHAVKRHSKRLNEIFKKLGHHHNLMQSQEIFANILGIQSYHELNTILQKNASRFILPEEKMINKEAAQTGLNIRSIIKDEKTIEALVNKKKGLTLITGVTGSGKSHLMKHLVQEISDVHQNRIGIADEWDEGNYVVKGGIIVKRNMNSDEAMKAMLRTNMDVIIASEVRSSDNINMLIAAAETGHKVYSQCHAYSVFSTLSRLINLLDYSQKNIMTQALIEVLDTIINVRLVSHSNGMNKLIYEYLTFNKTIKNELIDIYTNHSGNEKMVKDVIDKALDNNETSLKDMLLNEFQQGFLNKQEIKKLLANC
jgi:Tfp pilus assembly pilus retraction ATPase PilT